MADQGPNSLDRKTPRNNGMRAIGEGDRSPEFRANRDRLLDGINGLVQEAQKAQRHGNRVADLGSSVVGTLGIERSYVHDPFGGLGLGVERRKPAGFAYVAEDPTTADTVFFVPRPVGELEVRSNATLQAMYAPTPEDPDRWAEAGSAGRSVLGSIIERDVQGNETGFTVEASGSVHQITQRLDDSLGPKNSEPIAMGVAFVQQVQREFFSPDQA